MGELLLKMATGKCTLESQNIDMSSEERDTGAGETTLEMKFTRKRKKDEKMDTDDGAAKKPNFPAIVPDSSGDNGKSEFRKVPIPPHRYTPLKENWMKIFTPVVEHLHLQIRFNLKTRHVEIKAGKETQDISNVQKAADFVKAFINGFDVDDPLALLRLDDLFLDSFEVQDVKALKGDHLARAVGRLAGKGGRTKYTIENVTKTRIILAETKIHILGSYANIQIAKRALCNLILGSPPSKVYGTLRTVAARSSKRF